MRGIEGAANLAQIRGTRHTSTPIEAWDPRARANAEDLIPHAHAHGIPQLTPKPPAHCPSNSVVTHRTPHRCYGRRRHRRSHQHAGAQGRGSLGCWHRSRVQARGHRATGACAPPPPATPAVFARCTRHSHNQSPRGTAAGGLRTRAPHHFRSATHTLPAPVPANVTWRHWWQGSGTPLGDIPNGTPQLRTCARGAVCTGLWPPAHLLCARAATHPADVRPPPCRRVPQTPQSSTSCPPRPLTATCSRLHTSCCTSRRARCVRLRGHTRRGTIAVSGAKARPASLPLTPRVFHETQPQKHNRKKNLRAFNGFAVRLALQRGARVGDCQLPHHRRCSTVTTHAGGRRSREVGSAVDRQQEVERGRTARLCQGLGR